MKAWLFDGNLLVALCLPNHPHHTRSHRWFASIPSDFFATCLITQGTLLRLHMQFADDTSAGAAWKILRAVIAHPKHVYWNDAFSYQEFDPGVITGHRQVTDAWLAELARRRHAKLATLDAALATLHDDTAFFVPVL